MFRDVLIMNAVTKKPLVFQLEMAETVEHRRSNCLKPFVEIL